MLGQLFYILKSEVIFLKDLATAYSIATALLSAGRGPRQRAFDFKSCTDLRCSQEQKWTYFLIDWLERTVLDENIGEFYFAKQWAFKSTLLLDTDSNNKNTLKSELAS